MVRLDVTQLSSEQRVMLAAILNHEGDGNHPPADERNLSAFTREYATRCVERALGKASAATYERVAALWASM